MELPFKFGHIVSGGTFVNRGKDKERLMLNLKGGLHTTIISPRRWGKSSLVRQVSEEMQSRKFRFCFIDMFHVGTEEEFYKTLATEVLKASSGKTEEWVALIKKALKSITPRLSFGTDPIHDFEISFDLEQTNQGYREVLDMPEKIAREKNIRIAICIDEFQNLSRFDNPLLFQQRLRASWQHHKNVSYCLYGSKRNMLRELFENKSMPFYKFGDVMYLEKIGVEEWVEYIRRRFVFGGKKISADLAVKLTNTVSGNPYYLQQLAHLCWVRTSKSATQETLDSAIEDLLNQNRILFQKEIEGLSNPQIGFLKAFCDKVDNFHSAPVMSKYKLGASSNVVRIKEALEKKEIVDSFGSGLEFLDPVFELWFKKEF